MRLIVVSLQISTTQLLPRHVQVQVYRALLESNAAFFAAQMTAMDAATRNSAEMLDNLTLYMNKVRQAAITREIIEVVSGAAAKFRPKVPDQFTEAHTRSWSSACHFLLVDINGRHMEIRAIGDVGADQKLADIPRKDPAGRDVSGAIGIDL